MNFIQFIVLASLILAVMWLVRDVREMFRELNESNKVKDNRIHVITKEK